MLTDSFRPRSVGELVWSTQKKTQLRRAIDEIVHGPQLPRIMLLYGPAGCSKETSLEVMLRSLDTTPADATCGDDCGGLQASHLASSQGPLRGRVSSSLGNAAALTQTSSTSTATSSSARTAAAAAAATTRGTSRSLKRSREESTTTMGVSSTSSSVSPEMRRVCVHSLHSCDTDLDSYYTFLRSIISNCVTEGSADPISTTANTSHTSQGDTNNSCLSLVSSAGSASSDVRRPQRRRVEKSRGASLSLDSDVRNSDDDDEVSVIGRDTSAVSRNVRVVNAYIVKFYGEPALSPLHRLTANFVTGYERLSQEAERDKANQQRASAPHAEPLLMRALRNNLVFFVHTTHDTHSEKVDLYGSFPDTVLQSSYVERFHCSPITTINMKKRLQHIVDTVTSSHRAGKGRSARVTSDEVGTIAASSQGDIRQALLQLQWVLLATGEDAEGTQRAGRRRDDPWAAEADAVIDRLAAASRSRAAERSAEAGVQMATADSAKDVAAPATYSLAVPSRVRPAVDSESDTDECGRHAGADANDFRGEAYGLMDSALFSSWRPNASPSVTPHEPIPQSQPAPPLAGTTSPPPSSSPSVSRKRSQKPARGRSIIDLLDEDDDVENEQHFGASVSAAATRATNVSSHSAPGAGTVSQPLRSVVPTTRDECLDVSHAAARLLTQKYALHDVLAVLNVAPRRLAGYLSNNLPFYFSPSQVAEYASCAAALSDGDRCPSAEASAYGAARGSQRHRGNAHGRLSERTTLDDEQESHIGKMLDLIALETFQRTYTCLHRHLHIPRGFLAQRPPPYLESAYPRVTPFRSSSRYSGGGFSEFSAAAAAAAATADRSPTPQEVHQEWVRRAMVRLRSVGGGGDNSEERRPSYTATGRATGGGATAASLGCGRPMAPIADVVREGLLPMAQRCGSTDAAMQDYLPFARMIVTDRRTASAPLPPHALLQYGAPKTEAAPCAPTSAHLPPPRASLLATSSQSSSGPGTRTKMTFASALATRSGSTRSSPPPPPAAAPAPTSYSRRTTFTMASITKRGSAKKPPSSLPVVDKLQREILLVGTGSASCDIRKDSFVVVAADDAASQYSTTDSLSDKPLIPLGYTIEEYED